MAGKSKGDDTEKAPGGKKKLIIAVIAAVVVAGGAGGGVFFMTKGSSSAAAATEKVVLVPGAVVTLDPISLNLTDGHYLKVGLALQSVEISGAKEGASGPDGSKALDLAIGEFSNLSMADLSNAGQRQHYKDELQEKVIKAYTTDTDGKKEETVMGIYLTQFVMQ
ncbi:MAG: flagellar basal body-associated FliL family protein [Janthinobacterium lividum]